MERILSDDERLRKAEEIYFRRNNKNIDIVDKKEKKRHLFVGSKMMFQLLLLFNIAVVIVAVQNKDYIFTEAFLAKCSEYNMNINEKFNHILKTFLTEDTQANVVTETSEEHTEKIVSEGNKNIEGTTDAPSTLENSNEATNVPEQPAEQQVSSLSEMNTDIENLKSAYHFMKPITGVVSSLFGARESEYQNVTGYHTGVDIAAETGTKIKASMEGIVDLVSDQGDYR